MMKLLLAVLLLLSFSACKHKQQTTFYFKYIITLCDENDSCTGVAIYKSELSPDDFVAQLQKKYPHYTIHGRYNMYKHTN